jgi:putative endonuclease
MNQQEPTLAGTSDDAAERPWVLYLLECAGDRLYAGITNDLPARFAAHRAGRGARFTKAFAPLRIVAAARMASRSQALKAEIALKRRPRADKLRFLAGCGTLIAPDQYLAP